MRIYDITDKEFSEFGRIAEGYHTQAVLDALSLYTPLPEHTAYVPKEPALQNLEEAKEMAKSLYGGLPVQFGWCNGHNTKLNCLEYHRDSEFNLGTEDFILLLAKQSDVVDDKLDTSKVRAFRVPKGVLVEVYATSLHYAPCHTDPEKGFRVMVALPEGTNSEKPDASAGSSEDKLLWARNKWLLAHPDSSEAAEGAWIGLTGDNIDIALG